MSCKKPTIKNSIILQKYKKPMGDDYYDDFASIARKKAKNKDDVLIIITADFIHYPHFLVKSKGRVYHVNCLYHRATRAYCLFKKLQDMFFKDFHKLPLKTRLDYLL